MTNAVNGNGLSLNSRARYTVKLQGVLDPSWADRLGGMQIINHDGDSPGSPPVTTLTGDVADQAALAGILSTVYMLGMPLISVTFMGNAEHGYGRAPLLE